jgi:spoIIIJ-associated protein
MTSSSVGEPTTGKIEPVADDGPARSSGASAGDADAGNDAEARVDDAASGAAEDSAEVDGPEETDKLDDAGSEDEAGDEGLFRQSEIAADYVEGLLDVLDLDGDIDELVASGRPVVEVVEVQQFQRGGGVRLQSLVGQRGSTLEALQDLARLAVFRRTGTPSRLLLDIGGYRATRRSELAAVARNAIERVKEHGEPVRLEPMSAFERKCVHDVINVTDGVVSESQGEEPNRRIMVHPE